MYGSTGDNRICTVCSSCRAYGQYVYGIYYCRSWLGLWCRPLTAWHPLHISGSGVGTDLGSGDIISGSGVGTDLGSGPISNVSKHMRMYYQEVFGLLAAGRGMGWKPLLVPYWVVVGSWVLGSWWWSWGGALLQMRSIFLWVSSLRYMSCVCSFFGCLGSSLGFRPFARSVSRASSASLSSLRGPGRGALSLLGSGVGSPGAPWPGTLSGFALNTRARETLRKRPFWAISGPFRGGNTR